MRKHLMMIFFASILFVSTKAYSQITDSAAMAKSQKRIEGDLKDASKHQRKIDKSQRRIEKQQKRINRQERRRGRNMKSIEKEQKSMSN